MKSSIYLWRWVEMLVVIVRGCGYTARAQSTGNKVFTPALTTACEQIVIIKYMYQLRQTAVFAAVNSRCLCQCKNLLSVLSCMKADNDRSRKVRNVKVSFFTPVYTWTIPTEIGVSVSLFIAECFSPLCLSEVLRKYFQPLDFVVWDHNSQDKLLCGV